MNSELCSKDDFIQALRNRMRVGEGLSAPYARKWAIGGCEASHSLWQYPHDAISDFASGLLELRVAVAADDNGISIDADPAGIWVGVNGKSRNADRASEFLIGERGEKTPVFVVNSPEVVIEFIRAYNAPLEPIPLTEIIQVGFPGIHDGSRTYVGSWQWNVHGEAQGAEVVSRAANATLSAIRAKEAERGD
jgi:hypothetical protein